MAKIKQNRSKVVSSETKSYGILNVHECIPNTPHKEAAIALGNGLLKGDFTDFENQLCMDVEHIGYEHATITGKRRVINYWKGWRTRYVKTRKARKFDVVYSNYYSNACLLLEMMVVMFYIRGRKIRKILLIDHQLNPKVGHHDDILDFPFDLESITPCLLELRSPSEQYGPVIKYNRIPCLSCGTPSEKLEWHSSLFQSDDVGYSGIISICPHCHKVVEYYPEVKFYYSQPVDPKEAKYPKPHHKYEVNYNQELYGICNFESGNPLRGSKYVEKLKGETREAAEDSNWFLLSAMKQQDFKKVRECYLNAVEDGVYEAANNLGIFAYNFENKAEEGKKLFKKAFDGGSHYAMLNMFTVLWTEERYEEAINLLTEVSEMPSPSLKCLMNLAFFYYEGSNYAHNPIKEKNEDIVIKILKKILEKEGDPSYNEDKIVFKAAKDFMKYLDHGNAFVYKAKDYHKRLKEELDSLIGKDCDSILDDLDELSLEEGYHLGLHIAEQKGMGDESSLYVYDSDNHKNDEITDYIHVNETPMGGWQVYLLLTSPALLPAYWHGCYIERTFILQRDDLYNIKALQFYDLSGLMKLEILDPQVNAELKSGILFVDIYCCYWNEWRGIVREHVEIQIYNNKVISCGVEDDNVIYKYDCGIYF